MPSLSSNIQPDMIPEYLLALEAINDAGMIFTSMDELNNTEWIDIIQRFSMKYDLLVDIVSPWLDLIHRIRLVTVVSKLHFFTFENRDFSQRFNQLSRKELNRHIAWLCDGNKTDSVIMHTYRILNLKG